MTRATDLEAQLAALPPKACEEKTSRIRIQLCEVLSDILLTDPQFALRKDCSGRLWRNCFYARIGELRSRIAREKRKKGQGPSVVKLEQSLKVFLKEAIALYKYIIDNYETKLLPSSQTPQDNLSDSMEAVAKGQDGVVPGLHRILIHLGDLHRYSTNYSQAEKCYDRASKLAPGKGNPYNQLAVVAQLKDPSAPLSCVALYYYARALMASHDPFETSKANLARLLESNREYLENASEDDMLAATNKTGAEKERARKTIQSRLFLALFVDLHYDFFHVEEDCRKSIAEEELVDKMQVVLIKLESMLKEWAFGDSLLSKMVVINAFSVRYTEKSNEKHAMARAFTLRFGAALAERLALSLRKARAKNNLSVRLLLPIIILCDYVSTWNDSPESEALGKQAREFCDGAKQSFWSKMATVATHLSHLRNSTYLHEATVFSATAMRLKEYDNLRGFAPFDSFVKCDDVYISVDEAICVLELQASASTQESTFTQNTSSGPEENSIKLKRFFEIVEIMVEKEHLSRSASGQYHVRLAEIVDDLIVQDYDVMGNDPIIEFESSEPADEERSCDEVTGTLLPSQKDGPMLVYKRSESGSGPALLVPGALLLSKSQEAPSTDTQDRQGSVEISTKELLIQNEETPLESMLFFRAAAKPLATGPVLNVLTEERPATAPFPPAQLGPPPGILPPPGFGAPGAVPGFGAPGPASGFGVPTAQPAPMPGFAIHPSFPSAGQSSFGVASNDLQTVTPSGFSHGDTVLQMLRGTEVKTSNPFLISHPAQGAATGLFPSQASFSELMDYDMDGGASLLDSSLLNSMLMDENNSHPRSKNPFLT